MSNPISLPAIRIVSRQTSKTFGLLRNGVLEKHIKESPHLLWREGGVPCLDAEMWDKYKNRIDSIVIYTDKGRIFSILGWNFEGYKQELNLGYGRQYWIDKKYWKIINLAKQL